MIELASKVESGTASDLELHQYNNLLNSFQKDNTWSAEMGEVNDINQIILLSINRRLFSRTRKLPIRTFGIAASVLIICSLSILFFVRNLTDSRVSSSQQLISPGQNKALLTLSNGKNITLANQNGLVTTEDETAIVGDGKGALIYSPVNTVKDELIEYNTLTIPKGGIYRLVLSDGTKVWLNSDSRLRYPVAYGERERVVELEGEAYFEVAKDSSRPFRVVSAGQQIEVKGTHFNVNAYRDEPYLKTTLLEGAVSIFSGRQKVDIFPTQEGIVYSEPGHRIEVRNDADLESAVAWKNGNFYFNEENLPSIMRKISKWYDVEVVYRGDFSSLRFNGIVSRSKDINTALAIIEAAGNVHFKIEGRIITVTP